MLKKDLQQIKYAIIPLLIYCIIMQLFFNTVCPLKAFFNFDCPGCGLTRASIYLLTGQINNSLNANPTAIFWIISIILFIIDRYIYKLKINIFPLFFIISSIITISYYFLKLII